MSAADPPVGYLAPAEAARAELVEKGSRFLAVVEPVAGAEQAQQRLSRFNEEFRDATHVCWAWRLGDPARERCSDAGEPAGTAGPPILRRLSAVPISDVLGVVVRWFGGVKLGRGGLVRAYGGAIRAALEQLDTEERAPMATLEIVTPYALVGAVQRLVQPPSIELASSEFAERATMRLRVRVDRVAWLRDQLAALGIVPRTGSAGTHSG